MKEVTAVICKQYDTKHINLKNIDREIDILTNLLQVYKIYFRL